MFYIYMHPVAPDKQQAQMFPLWPDTITEEM